MREILFKAKMIDTGEWIEGIPIKTHIGLFMCFDENPHYCNQYGYMEIDRIIKVDENTLCQYTGLTDKNGNKIWENDVVLEIQPNRRTFKITYDVDAFCVDGHGIMLRVRNAKDKIEVIGNIYDNPGLLEGGT